MAGPWNSRRNSPDGVLVAGRKTPNPDNSPVLVHCSAGIGRTGTYIALDYLLDRALSDRKVDVFRFACDMRRQRRNMIQTKEQYACVNTTLYEALTEQYACVYDSVRGSDGGLYVRIPD
ncbi:receptor-type tyrosine-protein phosphatase epsilon-like, partial [Haliotis rubra]|uniref:receptor-type tyrosine-protein phosphatase epsilon-like n=1 Tax=Haliotis rubra TaxID=36100 RepID=UPI001EE5823A